MQQYATLLSHWCRRISDSISQNIPSQIFDVIQSDVALHTQVHSNLDLWSITMKKFDTLAWNKTEYKYNSFSYFFMKTYVVDTH